MKTASLPILFFLCMFFGCADNNKGHVSDTPPNPKGNLIFGLKPIDYYSRFFFKDLGCDKDGNHMTSNLSSSYLSLYRPADMSRIPTQFTLMLHADQTYLAAYSEFENSKFINETDISPSRPTSNHFIHGKWSIQDFQNQLLLDNFGYLVPSEKNEESALKLIISNSENLSLPKYTDIVLKLGGLETVNGCNK